MSSEQGESTSQLTQNNGRVCAYFQTHRGCVKGNACDFMHPLPESHLSNMAVHGGNMQGGPQAGSFHQGGPQAGSFHQGGPQAGSFHQAPSFHQGGGGDGDKRQKECSFFLTPRGCAKGNGCDFAHVTPQQTSQDPFGMYGMGGMGGMGGGGMGGMGGSPNFAMMAAAAAAARGGGMFPGMAQAHMMASGGRGAGVQFGIGRGGVLVPKRPKACEFFNTERGCVKGERCDFIHQKDKVCDFFFTDRGCRKGKFCDFKHPEKDANDNGEDGRPKASSRKVDKVCAYYLSERGCRKGGSCDFQHPEDGADDREKDKKKESTRYKPY